MPAIWYPVTLVRYCYVRYVFFVMENVMRVAYRLPALLAAMMTGLGCFAGTAAASPPAGHVLWSAFYAGKQTGQSGALAEAASPNGATLFVAGFTGYNSQEGASGGTTIAYNAATGAARWMRTTTRTGASTVIVPNSIAVSPSGATVFVSGYYDKGNTSGVATLAYSAATGATLWTRRYPRVSSPISLAVSPDGSRLFVMTEDYITLAYDTGTGQLAWASSPGGLRPNSVAARGAVSPDGSRVYLTGVSQDSGGFEEYQTAAYNAANGAFVWVRHYSTRNAANPGRQELATSVAVSRDGSLVYVAGCANGGVGSNAVLAYDSATGATEWKKLWLPNTTGLANAVYLAVSPDGKTVFFAGAQGNGATNWYVTQARSPSTGALLWSRSQPHSQFASPSAVAVSPGGSTLFVTGTRIEGGDGEAVYDTVAYSTATGKILWEIVDNGSDPVAIVAAPGGDRVFVTGRFQEGTNTLYATAAYRA
jgi:WD40 repeat protein